MQKKTNSTSTSGLVILILAIAMVLFGLGKVAGVLGFKNSEEREARKVERQAKITKQREAEEAPLHPSIAYDLRDTPPKFLMERRTSSGFVYRSDTRSFDQREQDMIAKTENWGEDKDQMVLIKPMPIGSLRPFYIDAYEAFISNYRAWSVPGAFPTDKIKYNDARLACEMAGKRLCSETEWRTACRGGYTQPIKMAQIQNLAKHCDFARSSTYDPLDYVERTNSHPHCTPPGYDVYHMIGNLAEFVEDERGDILIAGLTYYDAKMKNKHIALSNACERQVTTPGAYPAERFNKGIGFRCCRDVR